MKKWLLLIITLTIVFLFNSCWGIFKAITNNLNGIEKTLKDIYVFNPGEDGTDGNLITPHESDIVSVIIALDRNSIDFKLVLDINLTNNRNLIIRDYNGRLDFMEIQKIGDYALEKFYYAPNAEDDERYGHSYLGVPLKEINIVTGFKFKRIKEIINNYDIIYASISNLPEIIKEENKYIIYLNNKVYIVNFNSDDNIDARIEKILSINDPLLISNYRGRKYLLYKRKWTEEDAKHNLERISR
jgi:hypothetical protein